MANSPPRKPSLTVFIAGAACCAFAAIWLFWLFLANTGDLLDMLAAASNNAGPQEHLTRYGLTRPGPIRFTLTQFVLHTALLGVLIWTGCSLLLMWRSGRWCAIAFCTFAIATAFFGTMMRVFFLTLPGEVVKVGPLVLDAAVIVFAIILGAAMFLPSVAANYAGNREDAAGGAPAG